MAPYSNILAWEIPWTEEHGRLQSMGSEKVRDLATKESACNAGDPNLIPGLGRSTGEIGYSLQYSCLENSMDRRTWQATVHGVTKNGRQLRDFHFSPQNILIKDEKA